MKLIGYACRHPEQPLRQVFLPRHLCHMPTDSPEDLGRLLVGDRNGSRVEIQLDDPDTVRFLIQASSSDRGATRVLRNHHVWSWHVKGQSCFDGNTPTSAATFAPAQVGPRQRDPRQR
jgi:hypothetical protein